MLSQCLPALRGPCLSSTLKARLRALLIPEEAAGRALIQGLARSESWIQPRLGALHLVIPMGMLLIRTQLARGSIPRPAEPFLTPIRVGIFHLVPKKQDRAHESRHTDGSFKRSRRQSVEFC